MQAATRMYDTEQRINNIEDKLIENNEAKKKKKRERLRQKSKI